MEACETFLKAYNLSSKNMCEKLVGWKLLLVGVKTNSFFIRSRNCDTGWVLCDTSMVFNLTGFLSNHKNALLQYIYQDTR